MISAVLHASLMKMGQWIAGIRCVLFPKKSHKNHPDRRRLVWEGDRPNNFCLCVMMDSERLLFCDGLTQRQQCRHLPTLSQLWQKGHTVVHQLTFALFSTNMSSPLWWGDTKTTQRRFQNEHFEICSWQTKKKNGALGNQKSSTGQWPPRELVNWPTQLQSWNHLEKVQKGKWGKRGWH